MPQCPEVAGLIERWDNSLKTRCNLVVTTLQGWSCLTEIAYVPRNQEVEVDVTHGDTSHLRNLKLSWLGGLSSQGLFQPETQQWVY